MSLRYTSMKVGDTLGLLEYEIVDDKLPFDITGATVIFRMVKADGTVIIDDNAGVVVDGLAGVVGYQRVFAEVLEGLMNCQFRIVTDDGFFHISPNIQLLIEPIL